MKIFLSFCTEFLIGALNLQSLDFLPILWEQGYKQRLGVTSCSVIQSWVATSPIQAIKKNLLLFYEINARFCPLAAFCLSTRRRDVMVLYTSRSISLSLKDF